MKTTVEKISSNEVKISFEVEDDLMQKYVMKAYNLLKGRIAIPGFRKGHAPKKVIEMHYGKDVFLSEAFESMFREVYPQAIKDNDIVAVDQPRVDVVKLEADEPVEFTAQVYVYPDVELGKYKGVEATKQEIDVTDDDVMAEIERARESVARFTDIEDRPVKLDDEVEIDYEGYCEGEQFKGGTAKGQKLTVGSGMFIPGFEDQLIGKNAGDEVDVNVTFPDEYHAKELAGKPAVFKVKINSIREKELPDIDDEFAKDVSECDTLEEYKAQIREKLEKNASDRSDAAFENEVLSKVVDNCSVDIPQAMLDDKVESMLRELGMQMSRQGINMQQYMMMTGATPERLRSAYQQRAQDETKMELVLEAIRKAEGIEATPEEIEAEKVREAEGMGKTLEEFEQIYSDRFDDYFKNNLAMRKTVEMLKNEAVPESDEDEDGEEVETIEIETADESKE
ncbi:MAG: trigger factor [Clostridia bacterium]|nr:trigger factor [Clostridia bacterium]